MGRGRLFDCILESQVTFLLVAVLCFVFTVMFVRIVMALSVADKALIIEKYKVKEGDTGSVHVQVALLASRLSYLQKHFSTHVKDNHSRRGLAKVVGKLRRLLDSLKTQDVDSYKQLIDSLGLRK